MAEKREPSWLDEVSFATKFVVFVTVASVVGLALLKLVEVFL
ncbi:MAG: hypothetical protein AB7T31_01215 [Gemmatimonadales bacterium]